MSTPLSIARSSFQRLARVLSLPPSTIKASINMDAGSIVTITYTVFMTEEMISELLEFFMEEEISVGELISFERVITSKEQPD